MRKTVTNYTEADIKEAIDAVRNNRVKPSAAAKDKNIPLATLYARLSETRGSGPRGAKPILSSEEESFLVQTIEIFEKWQLPLLRRSVIEIARAFMIELDPGRRSVVVKRSTKHVISSQSGSGKEMTTVLICASASGKILPPYIIYAGTHLWNTWISMDHQVELLCLPPHSTTVLQPLDVVTLTKIKTAWRKLLVTHNTQTNSEKIDKKRFSYMIGDLWRNHILPSHCSSGFSRAGIYPYDPRAVSKEKLFEPPALSSSDAPSNFTDDIGLTDRSVLRPTRSLSCTAMSTDALAATTTPLQQPNLISSFAMTDDALTTTDGISSNLLISSSSNDLRDLSSSMVQSTTSENRSFTSSILEEVNQILYSQPIDPCDNSLLPIDMNAKSQQDISLPIIQPIEPRKSLSSIEDPSKNNSRNSLEVLTSVI
ncbi:unnamed protein product, partial [Rotaria sordida]